MTEHFTPTPSSISFWSIYINTVHSTIYGSPNENGNVEYNAEKANIEDNVEIDLDTKPPPIILQGDKQQSNNYKDQNNTTFDKQNNKHNNSISKNEEHNNTTFDKQNNEHNHNI